MHEKELPLTESNIEGAALVERVLHETLVVKTGTETSREAVLKAANKKILFVRFVITEDFDIWLSDYMHEDIISVNGLPSYSYDLNVEGYTGLQNGGVGIEYYKERGKFGKVFGALREKSRLSEDEFNRLCEQAVKQKIGEFLKPKT